MKSLKEIHNFWTEICNQPGNGNYPRDYLFVRSRSIFLCKLINRIFNNKDIKILEIGCNVGRNLFYLYNDRFENLCGLEINQNALNIFEKVYPEVFDNIRIIHSSVEDYIKNFQDKEFDLIFTMAVLEHIHPDSEWIFKEIVRITKNLITIEDETNSMEHIFKRNYYDIFTKLNMKQIEESCINEEEENGLNKITCRVFNA